MAGMKTASIDDLQGALRKAWGAVTSKANAEFIADLSLRTALRKDSRMDPIKEVLNDLDIYRSRRKRPKVIRKTRCSAVYDLQGTPGVVWIAQLTDTATKMALANGVSVIGLRNSA